MKKMKISVVAFASLLLGICLSAFTAPTEKPYGNGWFIYDGFGPVDNPSSYMYSGTTDPCGGTTHFCGFYGTQQASPNDDLPTQASLNSASSQSNDFKRIVTGLVEFKP